MGTATKFLQNAQEVAAELAETQPAVLAAVVGEWCDSSWRHVWGDFRCSQRARTRACRLPVVGRDRMQRYPSTHTQSLSQARQWLYFWRLSTCAVARATVRLLQSDPSRQPQVPLPRRRTTLRRMTLGIRMIPRQQTTQMMARSSRRQAAAPRSGPVARTKFC